MQYNYIKKILILFIILFLPSILYAETGIIKFDQDGSFFIEGQGLPKVKGSLFLWYDDWKYVTPSSVTSAEPNSWSGNMPEPSATSGHVSYTQIVTSSPDDSVDISLEFHKNGDIRLNRGIFMLVEFPMEEMSWQTIAFTHGEPYIAADAYRTFAKGFSVNLNESKALEFIADRACIFEHRGKEGESLMNIRLLPDADGKVNLKLSIKPAINAIVMWQETNKAKLAINDVILSKEQVPRYSMLELTVDMTATYDNLFEPDDIYTEALFTSPSGKKISIPGFAYQGFKSEQDGDLEILSHDGKPVWKVRFTPTEIGNYSVVVSAKDRSGKINSKEKKFTCIASDLKGFAKLSRPFVKETIVTDEQDSKSNTKSSKSKSSKTKSSKSKSSKKKADQETSEPKESIKVSKPPANDSPVYFQLDNGETLFIIGHNIPTYSPEIEEYFKKMEANGENYTRLWMYSSALGLEWGQPAGYYRLDEAWKLDKVLELALKHGIYIMLCFDTHQDFGENWDSNPYSDKQGGPCKTPLDFFRDMNVRKLYKNRLRYIAGRWSAYPNILAWEFMNEMEGWEGADQNRPVVTKWITEMANVLRKYDPYNHPISSSLWTTAGWPELWKLPEVDFVQTHFYADKQMDMAQEVANICKQKRTDYPDKLHLFAEYGIKADDGTAKNDPTGVHLHNGNWAGLMSGSASVPVSWWHESYIDPLNLYGVYHGIANFISGEKDLAKQMWKPLNATISDAKPNLRVLGMQTNDRALIWVQNKDYTWYNVRDKVQINPVPPSTLIISGFANGTYKLELWDTVNGTVIDQKEITAKDGTLSFDLPEVNQDYAFKIGVKK